MSQSGPPSPSRTPGPGPIIIYMMHAPSQAHLLLPLLLSHNPSPPRSLVRDGHTSPHRPRLVVSRSTCPPPFPPSPRDSLVKGIAVINTLCHLGGAKTQTIRREGPPRACLWKGQCFSDPVHEPKDSTNVHQTKDSTKIARVAGFAIASNKLIAAAVLVEEHRRYPDRARQLSCA